MNAISRYQSLIEDQPDNELLHFSLGKALFDAQRFPEAEIHLRLALEKKTDWMVVAMLLAQCAMKREDTASAKSYYEYALPLAIEQHHEGPEQEIRELLAVLAEMG
jgi:Flp pilus assembly protein TadD